MAARRVYAGCSLRGGPDGDVSTVFGYGGAGYFECAGYTIRVATISIQHAMAPRHQPSGGASHNRPASSSAMPTAMARHPSANKT